MCEIPSRRGQVHRDHQKFNLLNKTLQDNNTLHLCLFFKRKLRSSLRSFIPFSFNPIQDGLFRKGPPPSLKSVTYIVHWWNLAVIPYLKKIQKTPEPYDIPLELCWRQHVFHRKSIIFVLPGNTSIDCIFIHNF